MKKKLLAFIVVAVLAVAMALVAVVGVAWATQRISQMPSAAWRASATLVEALACICWLLLTVFIATRLAVLIFVERHAEAPSRPEAQSRD